MALTWINDGAGSLERVRYGHATVDPLGSSNFVRECGPECEGLRVWSAYKAACAYRADPALSSFRARTGLDGDNVSALGAYTVATVLVDAMLRSMTVHAPLTVAETFTYAGGGNRTLRAYDVHQGGCRPGPTRRR